MPKVAEGETGIGFYVTALTMTSFFGDYISFSVTIQPRLTILGAHIDHGVYMSTRHMTSDLDLIFSLKLR